MASADRSEAVRREVEAVLDLAVRVHELGVARLGDAAYGSPLDIIVRALEAELSFLADSSQCGFNVREFEATLELWWRVFTAFHGRVCVRLLDLVEVGPIDLDEAGRLGAMLEVVLRHVGVHESELDSRLLDELRTTRRRLAAVFRRPAREIVEITDVDIGLVMKRARSSWMTRTRDEIDIWAELLPQALKLLTESKGHDGLRATIGRRLLHAGTAALEAILADSRAALTSAPRDRDRRRLAEDAAVILLEHQGQWAVAQGASPSDVEVRLRRPARRLRRALDTSELPGPMPSRLSDTRRRIEEQRQDLVERLTRS